MLSAHRFNFRTYKFWKFSICVQVQIPVCLPRYYSRLFTQSMSRLHHSNLLSLRYIGFPLPLRATSVD
jgi:hypothetical protein